MGWINRTNPLLAQSFLVWVRSVWFAAPLQGAGVFWCGVPRVSSASGGLHPGLLSIAPPGQEPRAGKIAVLSEEERCSRKRQKNSHGQAKIARGIRQGLKPVVHFAVPAARLKSCSFTKPFMKHVLLKRQALRRARCAGVDARTTAGLETGATVLLRTGWKQRSRSFTRQRPAR